MTEENQTLEYNDTQYYDYEDELSHLPSNEISQSKSFYRTQPRRKQNKDSKVSLNLI